MGFCVRSAFVGPPMQDLGHGFVVRESTGIRRSRIDARAELRRAKRRGRREADRMHGVSVLAASAAPCRLLTMGGHGPTCVRIRGFCFRSSDGSGSQRDWSRFDCGSRWSALGQTRRRPRAIGRRAPRCTERVVASITSLSPSWAYHSIGWRPAVPIACTEDNGIRSPNTRSRT